MAGIGLAAAKAKLLLDVQKALYDGFKKTFILGAGDDGEMIAMNFAKTAAQPMADAIYNFVTQAQITGTNSMGVVAGTCAVGPVTGTTIMPFTGTELSLI